jgi:segregation and condensation protein B
MSKRTGKKKSEDTVRATADAAGGESVVEELRAEENGTQARAVVFGGDADSRGAAVEELDEALEALPGDDESAPEASNAEADANPLSRIDVSGETSFDSAGFAAEDEGAADEEVAEDEDGNEDEEAANDDEAGEEDDEEDDAEEDEADEDEAEEEDSDVVIHDADAEDRAEEFERHRAEELQRRHVGALTPGEPASADDEIAPGGQPRELAELVAVCEALIFVSEEPLSVKSMADLLGEDRGWMQVVVEELAKEFNERNGGLMLREVAGGWQFATRPEHHEQIRAYLKSKPSAKLSLAALETLAVIAYKQPVTVPEILEIRGVQSSSAIKTLLDKRLIIAKGRKETVGRPMMYGTSKEFLLQFGLKDLSELPNVEDFQDLAGGGEA